METPDLPQRFGRDAPLRVAHAEEARQATAFRLESIHGQRGIGPAARDA